MSKEQMDYLESYARTMLMMAKAFKENGNEISMKAYAQQGKEVCIKLMQAKNKWNEDITDVLHMVA